MRKEYLKGEDIETIYCGGGTPSQLEKEDFEQIFDLSLIHIYQQDCFVRELPNKGPSGRKHIQDSYVLTYNHPCLLYTSRCV